MKIDPSGIVFIGECEIQTPFCTALEPAPVMAIWGVPVRRRFDACGPCLEEMIRRGEWEIQGAQIPRKYDLAVYGKDERFQLVVELKDHPYKREADMEAWATRIRRNMVRHSAVPVYVYFLLAVYPAPFYLWLPDDTPDAPPRYQIDVQAQMPRLEESGIISDYQQQVDAVFAWLTALVNAPAGEPQAWLDDSGLRDAIQGGRIVRREIPAPPRREREPQAA